MTERQRDICESLDWRIHECEDGNIELENYSPQGEDLIFTVYVDEDFLEGIWRLAEEFDIDEHAELWIDQRGKNGVPGSISEILHDAEDIQGMLHELFEALKKEGKKV